MMMVNVHLNFHGAKIRDENKHPNFLLVILIETIFGFEIKHIKICIKNCNEENSSGSAGA